jgi:hypothetical protein
VRDRDHAAERRDVHDASAPTSAHRFAHRLDDAHRAEKIRIDRIDVIGDRERIDGTDLDDARDVEDGVDRAEFGLEFAHGFGDRYVVSNIADVRRDRRAEPAQFARGEIEFELRP